MTPYHRTRKTVRYLTLFPCLEPCWSRINEWLCPKEEEPDSEEEIAPLNSSRPTPAA